MLVYTVLFSMIISTTWATLGVDVSDPISTDAFRCLKSMSKFEGSDTPCLSFFSTDNGYDFAIVRVYREIGQVDANGAQTIKNAWNAGIAHVDGYIYPCLRCGNPAQQVSEFVCPRSH